MDGFAIKWDRFVWIHDYGASRGDSYLLQAHVCRYSRNYLINFEFLTSISDPTVSQRKADVLAYIEQPEAQTYIECEVQNRWNATKLTDRDKPVHVRMFPFQN